MIVMRRITSLIALLSLSGCTFNASWLEQVIPAEGAPGSFSTLDVDGTEPGSLLDGTTMRVVGTDRAASVDVRVVGLVGVNDDVGAITRGVQVLWDRIDASTMTVEVQARELPDALWIDALHAEIAPSSDLVLRTTSGSIEVEGITGRVEAHATSGSIAVSGAGIVDLSATSGSIAVTAAAGNAHADSGSIDLDFAGWVDASADSGSVRGRIGGGGRVSADSGSIELELTQPLDRDLDLSADSGSIELIVPHGTAAAFDLACGSGTVRVRVGELTYDGHELVGEARGGGFTIRARADSGSIRISER